MNELSDWINIFFIGMALLVILNLFLPQRVNYPTKQHNKNEIMESCTNFLNSSQKGEQLDEKDLKIQELEQEIKHYKERIEDFRSQHSIIESLIKNSLVVKEDNSEDNSEDKSEDNSEN